MASNIVDEGRENNVILISPKMLEQTIAQVVEVALRIERVERRNFRRGRSP